MYIYISICIYIFPIITDLWLDPAIEFRQVYASVLWSSFLNRPLL